MELGDHSGQPMGHESLGPLRSWSLFKGISWSLIYQCLGGLFYYFPLKPRNNFGYFELQVMEDPTHFNDMEICHLI